MMLWVLVIGLLAIAIALAVAVIGWHQVGELRGELEALQSRKSPTEVDFKMLAHKVAQLEISAEQAAAAASASQVPAELDERLAERARMQAEALAGLQRWADGHFTAVAGDAAQSARLVQELDRYAVRTLEHEVAAARPGSRMLRCGLYAQQPSVLDVGPMLLDELQSALGAEMMYQRADGPDGIRFYLRWPGPAPTPRLKLESLFHAAVTGVLASAEPGTAQLHAVLRALYAGGPAVLRLGPLLLVRTQTQMCARFLPADWPGAEADLLANAIADTPVTDVDAAEIIDLTGWADPQAA